MCSLLFNIALTFEWNDRFESLFNNTYLLDRDDDDYDHEEYKGYNATDTAAAHTMLERQSHLMSNGNVVVNAHLKAV